MKVAIVVQRYGSEITGGAEHHARMIAHRLLNDLLCEVEVFTTTAKDYMTWRDSYLPGTSLEDGITIRRYSPLFPRFPKLFSLIHQPICSFSLLLQELNHLPFASPFSKMLQWLWVAAQGPYTPSLVSALQRRQDEYQAIIFFTYLYFPTVVGIRKTKGKKILVPTLHDEPAAYFNVIQDVFHSADLILANTPLERQLIGALMPDLKTTVTLSGLGFDDMDMKKKPLTPPPLQQTKPYFLYIGRISKGKSVHSMIDMFLRYVESSKDKTTKLLLAGKTDTDYRPEIHPQIEYLGFIDERRKADYLSHCQALINPSELESLSIVVLEALANGVPVVLSANCPTFSYYGIQMQAVHLYRTEAEFKHHLQKLSVASWMEENTAIIDQAKRWVTDNFSWQSVMLPYENFLINNSIEEADRCWAANPALNSFSNHQLSKRDIIQFALYDMSNSQSLDLSGTDHMVMPLRNKIKSALKKFARSLGFTDTQIGNSWRHIKKTRHVFQGKILHNSSKPAERGVK